MLTQTFYHLALVTHIIGLTIMAGTTLVDYIITKQFWRQYAVDKPKGLAINQVTLKFARLFGIGMILLIISGVTMMGITRGVFGEQLWFRIKFGLILLVIINFVAFGRGQRLRLGKLLAEDTVRNSDGVKLRRIKNNISRFHMAQITFFIIIFILSVFKFN